MQLIFATFTIDACNYHSKETSKKNHKFAYMKNFRQLKSKLYINLIIILITIITQTLLEKYPNTEFFLDLIFPYSDKNKNSVF